MKEPPFDYLGGLRQWKNQVNDYRPNFEWRGHLPAFYGRTRRRRKKVVMEQVIGVRAAEQSALALVTWPCLNDVTSLLWHQLWAFSCIFAYVWLCINSRDSVLFRGRVLYPFYRTVSDDDVQKSEYLPNFPAGLEKIRQYSVGIAKADF
ncbi:uncharacterized protein ARMOST_11358 [Armillaria ostoyae]|uniref:Uncharacterized protein n=1 Tax=Armillaria ostoyae TaxID=47428 RepID=A0A284RGX9_ARMOS|nr:uncharacterized protein ARMOST_11358 [Armillaria ostoyae]